MDTLLNNLLFPIVRPFKSERAPRSEEDALVAPLPDLLLSRLSVGVFYQVFNPHKEELSRYFGHLLGEYVGIVLRIRCARLSSWLGVYTRLQKRSDRINVSSPDADHRGVRAGALAGWRVALEQAMSPALRGLVIDRGLHANCVDIGLGRGTGDRCLRERVFYTERPPPPQQLPPRDAGSRAPH